MREKGIDWPALLSAVAWPAIALLVLGLFYGPVRYSLDRISEGEADEVAVGPIRVQFSPTALRALPTPSPDVARNIQRLSDSPYERELLLSLGFRLQHSDSCTIEGFERAVRAGTREANDFFARNLGSLEGYRRYIGAHENLERMGLVTLERPGTHEVLDDVTCAAGEQRVVRITELGRNTQAYYLNLMDQALSIRVRAPPASEEGVSNVINGSR